jgi:toxin ParE1/3/4
MNHRVILSPDGKDDIRTAIRWYANIDPELAFRFEAEAETIVLRLAQDPYLFPISYKSIRKALLKRFPYTVYFTFNVGKISVLAVVHQRRLRPWDEL